jgi:thioredoxin 1
LLLLALIGGTWLAIYGLQRTFKKKGGDRMDKSKKIAIVAALIAAITVVLIVRQNESDETQTPTGAGAAEQTASALTPEQLTGNGRPTLIDLGSDTCIPCKQMAPILEEMKKAYAGSLDVHFLDVHKDPNLIPLYNVKLIPLQIFYDAAGKEIFRHEGYFAKEDILAKWKEFGVELTVEP